MKKLTLKKGALEGLVGFHVSTARVTTDALFQAAIGEPYQLRPVEFTFLILLDANKSLTPKQLSGALALSGPHLSQLLDRAQQNGWISRERDEIDGRSQKVALTPAGVVLARDLVKRASTVESDLRRTLSNAEMAMLLELLNKVAMHKLKQSEQDGLINE